MNEKDRKLVVKPDVTKKQLRTPLPESGGPEIPGGAIKKLVVTSQTRFEDGQAVSDLPETIDVEAYRAGLQSDLN